jgi:hypothetical protein
MLLLTAGQWIMSSFSKKNIIIFMACIIVFLMVAVTISISLHNGKDGSDVDGDSELQPSSVSPLPFERDLDFIYEISDQTQTYNLYDTYFMDGDEYAMLVICGNRMRIEGQGEDYDHLLDYFGISNEWYEFNEDKSGYFESEPQPYYQTDFCYMYFPNSNFVTLLKSPFYSANWKFVLSNANIDSKH